jgi:hypothetical protein
MQKYSPFSHYLLDNFDKWRSNIESRLTAVAKLHESGARERGREENASFVYIAEVAIPFLFFPNRPQRSERKLVICKKERAYEEN